MLFLWTIIFLCILPYDLPLPLFLSHFDAVSAAVPFSKFTQAYTIEKFYSSNNSSYTLGYIKTLPSWVYCNLCPIWNEVGCYKHSWITVLNHIIPEKWKSGIFSINISKCFCLQFPVFELLLSIFFVYLSIPWTTIFLSPPELLPQWIHISKIKLVKVWYFKLKHTVM